MAMTFDYVIIGGGIVGLSTAWQLLQRNPGKQVLLIEKESAVAQHQTGHNSGVIHAGIYYEPGSLKARFCKQGVKDTIAFCDAHDIPYEQCGKLIVATSELEMQRMHALFNRAQQNDLDVELVDAPQLAALEPNVRGLGAIHLKTTGIVDYRLVSEAMAACIRELGGQIRLDSAVTGLRENADHIEVITSNGPLRTDFLVACGGLQADRIAAMLHIETDFRIVPYRGEYYRLPAAKRDIVRHLIYPVPDPELPFLGVHLTRMIDGSVTVGPNAVQAWQREGYDRVNVSLRDIGSMLTFPGFWKVARKNFKTGLAETWNSWWKPGYLKQVQKYCPSIELQDLRPYPPGVRAQAVLSDGTLVHDFLFQQSPRSLHVCNAPSPAATSAIPIGNFVCDKIEAAQK
jgi:L-2-hydroxyglutarate oxidase